MKPNGYSPGKRQITSGLAKCRSVWKHKVFCSLWHFAVTKVSVHPIRHFAKPPGVMCNSPYCSAILLAIFWMKH